MSSLQHHSSHFTENPLVTIAIPTFNRAAWLKICIGAALAQTYQNIEIVVSDNASTDKTSEILPAFDDKRLRVIKQPTNIGPVANCNACIDAAKGDYIVLVPDDDKIAPEMLEKCVGLIRQAPEIPVVLAVGDVFVAKDNHIWPGFRSKKLSTGIWDGADILLEYLNDKLSVHQCTVLLHTATLRAHGGFAKNYPFVADIATWLPILLLGRAGLVNESCGTYSLHESTQTSAFEVSTRLQEVRRVVDLVNSIADQNVKDAQKRRLLKSQARGYFARHATGLISSQRRRGATWSELLPLIRHWRRDIGLGLPYVAMSNAARLLSNLALLVLPLPMTYAIRRCLRYARKSKAAVKKQHPFSESA
jgi:glycosyltransferase involved in cell wall biosynthesis